MPTVCSGRKHLGPPSLSAPLLLLLTKMGEGLDQPSPIPKK